MFQRKHATVEALQIMTTFVGTAFELSVAHRKAEKLRDSKILKLASRVLHPLMRKVRTDHMKAALSMITLKMKSCGKICVGKIQTAAVLNKAINVHNRCGPHAPIVRRSR